MRPMNTGPREWDAETYDRVSDPQFNWGMEVLERLELAGDETVIDAGSGTGGSRPSSPTGCPTAA